MTEQTIGFIGAGNMATSLVGGMINQGIKPAQIWLGDVSQERLTELSRQYGVHVSDDNAAIAQQADVLVLAVKPQVMQPVCEALRLALNGRQPLIISIAAGVTVGNLKSWLGDLPVVRCMPNTPALVQTGATGLYAEPSVSSEQKDLAEQILNSVGLTFWLAEEKALDAVTAVSGSGPAYFFLMMESMIAAGCQLGLDADTSRQLVLQTALGAAKLASSSTSGPDVLRQQVTSPGGTTAAALDTFEQGGFRELVNQALAAAHRRSEELAG
jgi:pyrroline-5-carboxylate reductase